MIFVSFWFRSQQEDHGHCSYQRQRIQDRHTAAQGNVIFVAAGLPRAYRLLTSAPVTLLSYQMHLSVASTSLQCPTNERCGKFYDHPDDTSLFRMSLESYVQQFIDFVRQNEAWAPPIVFALALGESLVFISFLLPAWAALVTIGGLVGVSEIQFWPVWIGASIGAALGDWLSYWIGLNWDVLFAIAVS
jgi:hypothetical protein